LREGDDGAVKVTDIDAGRFFTTSKFFAAAGLNMPDILVQRAPGERPQRRGSSSLPPDLYWLRMVDTGFALVRGEDLDPWARPE
jgi:carbamoyl-phosphate synthase large subunit